MLEFEKEPFDEVAFTVEFEVTWDLWGGYSWWNHDFGSLSGDGITKRFCVISFVAKDVIGRQTVNQGLGLRDVAGLTRREDKPQRVAQCIDDRMDFGRQSATRAADRTSFRPPLFARRMLVRPDNCGVDHDVFEVWIISHRGK
jgi:hypothetical protein